jgi:flagellar basal-body rod protein FlgF
MLRGVAIATSQLVAQNLRLETLAANLADVDTPGYRQDRIEEQAFSRLLLDRIGAGEATIGGLDIASVMSRPTVDLTPGPIDATDRPLDVAITGDGFFVVQAPDGLRYTRRGAFRLDGQGQLTSLEGWPVLGQTGPLRAAGPVSILPTGEVTAGGQVLGRLQIVTFPPGTAFDRRDGTYLVPAGGAAGQVVANPRLLPGHLEGSNVDLATTMTDVIAATRSYQAAQKALVTEDDALGRLIDQVNAR